MPLQPPHPTRHLHLPLRPGREPRIKQPQPPVVAAHRPLMLALWMRVRRDGGDAAREGAAVGECRCARVGLAGGARVPAFQREVVAACRGGRRIEEGKGDEKRERRGKRRRGKIKRESKKRVIKTSKRYKGKQKERKGKVKGKVKAKRKDENNKGKREKGVFSQHLHHRRRHHHHHAHRSCARSLRFARYSPLHATRPSLRGSKATIHAS